ncbi:Uncharacterized protein TC_0206 [Chlamydiales bacterium SCGC AG-110-P3]|nr:Uncharacterized protein TC_0206 [Chlamydiales bacterium SCGC AG-110-P3]
MGIYDRDYVRYGNSADAAVRTFSNQVYSWMSIGLGLTALIAYGIARSGLFITLMPFWWVFALGTLGVGLCFNGALTRGSFTTVAGLFLAYATLEGLFFGVTLPVYAAAYGGNLIWTAFATASVVFGGAVGYGVFTQSDLTSVGRILQFALMGLIAVTLLFFVLSFFIDVTWMHLAISYIGLVIFTGLTAYDAQQIKAMSRQVSLGSPESYKMSLAMALKMYINVIMIFWYLLQIFSSRRD